VLLSISGPDAEASSGPFSEASAVGLFAAVLQFFSLFSVVFDWGLVEAISLDSCCRKLVDRPGAVTQGNAVRDMTGE